MHLSVWTKRSQTGSGYANVIGSIKENHLEELSAIRQNCFSTSLSSLSQQAYNSKVFKVHRCPSYVIYWLLSLSWVQKKDKIISHMNQAHLNTKFTNGKTNRESPRQKSKWSSHSFAVVNGQTTPDGVYVAIFAAFASEVEIVMIMSVLASLFYMTRQPKTLMNISSFLKFFSQFSRRICWILSPKLVTIAVSTDKLATRSKYRL